MTWEDLSTRLLILASTRTAVTGFLLANAFGVYVFHTPILVSVSPAMHSVAIPAIGKTGVVMTPAVIASFGFVALVRKVPGLKTVISLNLIDPASDVDDCVRAGRRKARSVLRCRMASGARDLRVPLKQYFGHSGFRPNQREIIEAILSRRDVFAALPTGGGKSLCYQLPALLSDGLTVVVSPLIALMKDQVDGAERMGIPATFLNSSLSAEESRERWGNLARGDMRLLYVSPERIANDQFREALRRFGLAFIAVDEAHCISEWGHEFRPDYRSLRLLRKEFPQVPIAAFTATATRQVQADVVKLLGLKRPLVVRASFNRPEIFYRTIEKSDIQNQILDFVSRHNGEPGIVYRATRKDTELTARTLSANGVRALPYHAGLDDDTRRETQEKFLRNEIQAVVATIAFGMGIDKPDVRWVVHGDLPRSIEGYYQETGRAARDGRAADTALFFGRQDIAKIRWHIGNIESARERENAETRLREILRYVESNVCRRRLLLAHFDEEHPGNCGACDVCAGEVAMEDLTEPAQMILSAAVRTGERFGAHHLVDIVTGTSTDKVIERGHNLLPTFGVGADRDRSFWLSLARDLSEVGYLVRGDGELAGFRLSQQGRLLLAGKISYVGQRRAPVTGEAKSGSRTRRRKKGALSSQELRFDDAAETLLSCLREARKRAALERGVPAYLIFSDRSLRDIAARRPAGEEQLLSCYGVGPQKAARYGAMVLRIVYAFQQGEGCPETE